MDEVFGGDLPTTPQEDAPETLGDVASVVRYLSRQGWSCSERSVYRHVSERKLKKTTTGVFTVEAVERYARRCLKRVDGTRPRDDATERLQEQKLREEIRRLKADSERREILLSRERGNVVDLVAVQREFSARAQLLRSDFEGWAHEVPLRIVDRFGLPTEAMVELRSLILEAGREWFGRYTQPLEFVRVLEDRPEELPL